MTDNIDGQKGKKKQMKKAIMQKLNELKPKPNASVEEAIECLVRQAQFYTNFLISKHNMMKKSSHETEAKRRGHFDDEES